MVDLARPSTPNCLSSAADDRPRSRLAVLAGVASGRASSLAGLASVVSYPALLALGLPPIAANVSNTTAMTGVLLGSAVISFRIRSPVVPESA
jgi:uncharacterized membrane protein YfcA